MARINKNSKLAGALGPLIMYEVNGKTYIRTKPARVKQPNTPAQLAARDKFRQSSLLAKHLYAQYPLLGLDDDENRDKSGYHEMLGHLRRGVFQEGVQPMRWEWEKLCFRLGTPPSVGFTLEPTLNAVTVHWTLRYEPEDGFVVLIGINTQNLDVVVKEYEASLGTGIIPMYSDGFEDEHAYYAVFRKHRNGKPKMSEAVFLGMKEGNVEPVE